MNLWLVFADKNRDSHEDLGHCRGLSLAWLGEQLDTAIYPVISNKIPIDIQSTVNFKEMFNVIFPTAKYTDIVVNNIMSRLEKNNVALGISKKSIKGHASACRITPEGYELYDSNLGVFILPNQDTFRKWLRMYVCFILQSMDVAFFSSTFWERKPIEGLSQTQKTNVYSSDKLFNIQKILIYEQIRFYVIQKDFNYKLFDPIYLRETINAILDLNEDKRQELTEYFNELNTRLALNIVLERPDDSTRLEQARSFGLH